MSWTVWALLLIAHGAYSRWAQNTHGYAKAAVFGDGLLIAIALVTLERLQGLDAGDVLRIGVFFVAFGTSGRHLMSSLLRRFASQIPTRADAP